MARENLARIGSLDKVLVAGNRKLQLTSPIKQLSKPKFWAIMVLSVGVLVTGLLFAWSHLQYITISYQISQAFNDQKELHDFNRKLRIELANLKSLNRLEQLALEKFNMAPPGPGQVVNIR